MARQERSAGFIIYIEPDGDHAQREFLLLDYGRHWDYPKGHVEQGEDDLTAARRELLEETGLADVEVQPGFQQEIEYFFRQKKAGLIQKKVIFFLARVNSRQITLSHEHSGHAFLSADAAVARTTFASSKTVLREAIAFLDTRSKASA